MVKIGRVKRLTLRYRPDEQTARSQHPLYFPDCHKWRVQMLEDCIGKNAIERIIAKRY